MRTREELVRDIAAFMRGDGEAFALTTEERELLGRDMKLNADEVCDAIAAPAAVFE